MSVLMLFCHLQENNLYTGDLIPDAHHLNQKVKKMLNLIEKRTVSVGQVKPLMVSAHFVLEL